MNRSNPNHPAHNPPPPPHLQRLTEPITANTIAYIETSEGYFGQSFSGPHGEGGGGGGNNGKSNNSSGNTQNQSNNNNSDVAGVLRRNQACLACRRRKLKCDAARPHCGTCIRSHKHLLRTSPKSNPVLSCEYDDVVNGNGNGNSTAPEVSPITGVSTSSGNGYQESTGTPDDDVEEENGGGGRSAPPKSKKRKSGTGEGRAAASGGGSGNGSNGGTARKNKSGSGESAEAERLRKKIEELEAQLAKKNANANANHNQNQYSNAEPRIASTESHFPSMNNRPWQNTAPIYSDSNTTAPSPTAFLEMLSTAAEAQAPSPAPMPGMRSGASTNAMIIDHSGFTPMYTFEEPTQPDRPGFNPIQGDIVNGDPSRPGTSGGLHSASGAGSVSGGSGSGFTPFTNSVATPQGPPLSPNVLFNFSPAPMGPPPTTAQSSLQGLGTLGATCPMEFGNTVPTISGGGVPQSGGMGQQSIPMEGIPLDSGTSGIENIMPNDDEFQQQLFMDLFWPGWPANLPEPHIVNDLIESFFELVPNMGRLLHKGRFLARMALPPSHSNFPHPSLIHSICSIASTWCVPAIYERSKTCRVLDSKGRPINFGLRHASLAKEAVHDGLNTGNRMFDVVRAMMILSRIFIDDTRMLECWAYNGLVARMILPLGLNVRSAELSLKSVMLPPPSDALEREERRAAMWFALYHDTIASAASGWGTSISLDELSVPLPVSTEDFESGAEHMEANPQDLDSPDLYTRHPVPDAFVMVMKSVVLMNRVTKFGRKWKNRHVKEDDDLEGMNRPEFRELANAIACFQMSFPPNLRDPCKRDSKRRLDIDLIAAHMIPHAAVICLYEPFADVENPNDGPARRILHAAQGIVGVIQQLAASVGQGTQGFESIMHSSASVCLVTAARTCLLFYRQALNVGDHALAASHKMDIEVVHMALGQFGLRFKIGHHHAQLVEYFLDRATYPTYDKLAAHYPEHPRRGAPELLPNSDFGVCIMNALNIKRGYWKMTPKSTGYSSFENTPESRSNSASGSAMFTDSPSGYNPARQTASAWVLQHEELAKFVDGRNMWSVNSSMNVPKGPAPAPIPPAPKKTATASSSSSSNPHDDKAYRHMWQPNASEHNQMLFDQDKGEQRPSKANPSSDGNGNEGRGRYTGPYYTAEKLVQLVSDPPTNTVPEKGNRNGNGTDNNGNGKGGEYNGLFFTSEKLIQTMNTNTGT